MENKVHINGPGHMTKMVAMAQALRHVFESGPVEGRLNAGRAREG